jgi:hypothetical protein
MAHTLGALYKFDGSKERGARVHKRAKHMGGVSVVDSYDTGRDIVTYKPFEFFKSRVPYHPQVPVISGPSSPTLAQQRTAFLTLVENNIHGIASAFAQDMKSNPTQWDQFWINQGGAPSDLQNAVAKGSVLPALMLNTTSAVSGMRMGSSPTYPTVFEGTNTPIPTTYTLPSKPPITGNYLIPKFSPGNYGGAGNYVADQPTLSAYNTYMYSIQNGQNYDGYYGWVQNGVYEANAQTDQQLRSVYQAMLTNPAGANAGGIIPLSIPLATGTADKGTPPVNLGTVLKSAGPVLASAANAIIPGSGALVSAGINALTGGSSTSTTTTATPLPPQIPGNTPPPPSGFPWIPVLIGTAVVGGLLLFALSD